MNFKAFIILTMLVLASTTVVFSQQSKIEVGGAIKFDINSTSSSASNSAHDFTGLNARMYYYLSDRFRVVPNISVHLPYEDSLYGYDFKIKLTTYNAQVHYLFDFFNSPNLKPYVLGGLSYNHLTQDGLQGVVQKETANDASLSLGAGVDYQVKFGKLFFEVQDMLGDYDPFVIEFGVMFSIK